MDYKVMFHNILAFLFPFWFHRINVYSIPDPQVRMFGLASNRGKENAHTKMRRKMAQKSRRINRLYEERSK